MLFLLWSLFTLPLAQAKDPFWWGVGHASFQVEGSPADSDWLRWTRTPGRVLNGDTADTATNFWKTPEQDFDLAKELGAKMFRLSIAWERIEPAPGKWDEAALNRYEAMIVQLRKRGIEPMVTLQHFVLPQWLAEIGGTTAPDFADYFTAYAKKVISRLALPPAQVQWWMTFNEPMVLVYGGYLTADFPPGLKERPDLAVKSAAGLARAHLKTMQMLHELRYKIPIIHVSVAAHWRDFQGKGWSPLNALLASVADWCFNRQFLDSIRTGKLFFWLPGGGSIREEWKLPSGGFFDYVGINYYGRKVISFSLQRPYINVEEGPGPKSDLAWEIYPEGLLHSLNDVYRLYALPILISENGVADATDQLRANFLKTHLEKMIEAKNAGVPVVGYLHWSLTDNFEWSSGFAPRFGLVRMDYAKGQRIPRASFKVYQELIRRWGNL